MKKHIKTSTLITGLLALTLIFSLGLIAYANSTTPLPATTHSPSATLTPEIAESESSTSAPTSLNTEVAETTLTLHTSATLTATTTSTTLNCTTGAHNWGNQEPWKPAPELYPMIWMVYCQETSCNAETRREHLVPNCDNGHDFEVIEDRMPTCWASGGKRVKCLVCDHEEWLNVQGALGHQFGPQQPTPSPLWSIVACQRPNCAHSTFIAANCDNGHDYEVITPGAPTCFAGGGDSAECKRCGHKATINWQPALGHSWGPPISTGNPLWNIVACVRSNCGHSTFIAAGR